MNLFFLILSYEKSPSLLMNLFFLIFSYEKSPSFLSYQNILRNIHEIFQENTTFNGGPDRKKLHSDVREILGIMGYTEVMGSTPPPDDGV